MRTVFTIIFLFIIGGVFSQSCENFNRKLFLKLPDLYPEKFPEKINCIDSMGYKQGWWINYKVEYDTANKTAENLNGEYVQSYSYGQYWNNKKIGDWNYVSDFRAFYTIYAENYYYSEDTILMSSFGYGLFENPLWRKSIVYYNKDSSIIKLTSIKQIDYNKPNLDTICIECDKKSKNIEQSCVIKYKNIPFKTFNIEDFEIEYYRAFYDYERYKRMINREFYLIDFLESYEWKSRDTFNKSSFFKKDTLIFTIFSRYNDAWDGGPSFYIKNKTFIFQCIRNNFVYYNPVDPCTIMKFTYSFNKRKNLLKLKSINRNLPSIKFKIESPTNDKIIFIRKN